MVRAVFPTPPSPSMHILYVTHFCWVAIRDTLRKGIISRLRKTNADSKLSLKAMHPRWKCLKQNCFPPETKLFHSKIDPASLGRCTVRHSSMRSLWVHKDGPCPSLGFIDECVVSRKREKVFDEKNPFLDQEKQRANVHTFNLFALVLDVSNIPLSKLSIQADHFRLRLAESAKWFSSTLSSVICRFVHPWMRNSYLER